MQSPSAHIHHAFLLIEHLFDVLALQRIRELYTELKLILQGSFFQCCEDSQSIRIFQVVFKCQVRNFCRESKFGIQQAAQFLRTQQRWIQFNGGMKFLLVDQIKADFTDLIRRTAMHGAECDMIGDAGGNRKFIDTRKDFPDGIFCCCKFSSAILHFIEKPLDIVPENTLEVIANAHIEQCAQGAFKSELFAQNMDDDPCIQVFIE